jgi:phage terminase large subunit GpA-like protein
MTTTEWARAHRRLSPKSTARPGRYNPDLTPWVFGMHEALDDPAVWKVVCRKSAQVAWTDGVLLNYIGRKIDIEPCPMIIMFAKEGSAKKFDREKFVPMVEVTPRLADKIPVHKARDRNNSWDHKGFAGGFLNFVGSNSPDSVKSTPAPVVAVEEPDDSNTNVKDQGDTITLLEERTKSFARRKVIFGGTPTIEGFSRVDAAFKGSDQRHFWVPCPECGEHQVLSWEHVKWTEEPSRQHEVLGAAVLESARYCCPHCGGLWSDGDKTRAVRKGQWRASASFNGIAGFAINELYSPFPGSSMPKLVEKYLTAQHALRQGDDTKLRSFRNNTEGLPYAYKSSVPTADKLRARGERYRELTVPWGGVVLTAGVDVQHDRLAIVIRAWGRGEESWLVWWGEVYGRTMVVEWDEYGALKKETSGAWWDLDQLLMGAFEHTSGVQLRVRAASIDSSDGQTQDAVYAYVRRRLGRGFMAIKGASHDTGKDIFSPPRLSVDTNGRHKPHPSGVKPYIVGTQVAKDLILGVDEQGGRIKLLGSGPGRMHWYDTVRPDYYDQITAEVKVPHKTIRGRLVWACQAGRRNEGTDCEVYALHAARSLKVNLWRDDRWEAEEAAIKQPGLFGLAAPMAQAPVASEDTTNKTDEAADENSQVKAVVGPQAAQGPAQAKPSTAPSPWPGKPTGGQGGNGWSAKKW